jgi:hypothetical protein
MGKNPARVSEAAERRRPSANGQLATVARWSICGTGSSARFKPVTDWSSAIVFSVWAMPAAASSTWLEMKSGSWRLTANSLSALILFSSRSSSSLTSSKFPWACWKFASRSRDVARLSVSALRIFACWRSSSSRGGACERRIARENRQGFGRQHAEPRALAGGDRNVEADGRGARLREKIGRLDRHSRSGPQSKKQPLFV